MLWTDNTIFWGKRQKFKDCKMYGHNEEENQ